MAIAVGFIIIACVLVAIAGFASESPDCDNVPVFLIFGIAMVFYFIGASAIAMI